MIQGAKELYFSTGFAYGMVNKDYRRSEEFSKDELQMQLWTIIDGDVYMEEGAKVVSTRHEPGNIHNKYINKYHIDQTREWKSQIDYCIKSGKFPKKIQFWTHSL